MGKILDKIIDNLFYDYVAMVMKSEDIFKLEADVENNRECLDQSLSKEQKKLLLRLQDGNNSIIETTNLQFFTLGFKLGFKTGYEMNNE